MKKQFGIVFSSELFDSEEEAILHASQMLLDCEIRAGVYVVEFDKKTRLHVIDKGGEVWE